MSSSATWIEEGRTGFRGLHYGVPTFYRQFSATESGFPLYFRSVSILFSLSFLSKPPSAPSRVLVGTYTRLAPLENPRYNFRTAGSHSTNRLGGRIASFFPPPPWPDDEGYRTAQLPILRFCPRQFRRDGQRTRKNIIAVGTPLDSESVWQIRQMTTPPPFGNLASEEVQMQEIEIRRRYARVFDVKPIAIRYSMAWHGMAWQGMALIMIYVEYRQHAEICDGDIHR